jgi:hypothetical protein
MSEVVLALDRSLTDGATSYRAQVCGRPSGNIWEGWIEFQTGDGDWIRTPRETTQPDRAALHYWAGGLSVTYLEGALARALSPPAALPTLPAATAHFDGPAAREPADFDSAGDMAILDPFSVGASGETRLRGELGALRGWHLINIIRAYDLADDDLDLEALSEAELIDLIVAAVGPSPAAVKPSRPGRRS